MTRDQMIEIVWQRSRGDLYVTREEFASSLDGWEITHEAPYMITATRGPEFHFASIASGPIPRSFIRKMCRKVVEANGYMIVRTPLHEVRQQRFNECIGFFKVGEDDFDIHYRLEKVK